MRPRVVVPACVAALVALTLLIVPATRHGISSLGGHPATVGNQSPLPESAHVVAQAPPPPPRLITPDDPGWDTIAKDIDVPKGASFFAWAFLDRASGRVIGSDNSDTGTNTTESMVKPWIASDYLRRLDQAGKKPSKTVLHELTLMIVDSNDNMAQKYYLLGGADADMQRMVAMCGLSHTSVHHNRWALTRMTPRDVLKYGTCVADGTAAGPHWTSWILDTMKHVRGGVKDQISVEVQGGRWGIIDGIPDNLVDGTSIKNGWTQYWDGTGWHVNCMAVNDAWIMSVMVRIGTLQQAADSCAGVAHALTVTPAI